MTGRSYLKPRTEVPVLELFRRGVYDGAKLVCGHEAFPLTQKQVERLRAIRRRYGMPMQRCEECSRARFGSGSRN